MDTLCSNDYVVIPGKLLCASESFAEEVGTSNKFLVPGAQIGFFNFANFVELGWTGNTVLKNA